MAGKTGRAGKSTREMAAKRRTSAIIVGLIGIAAIIVVSVLLQNAKILGIGGAGILVLLILIWYIIPDLVESQVDRKLKAEKRAIRGAKAEERIGGILEDLNEDYYVLHDIESPYGNIDHIVIGKYNGVFLIETKAHGGRVEVSDDTLLVNGKMPEKNFIAQALKNAYWLRDEINQVIGVKPWITPIVVFTNAFVSPTKLIKGVSIVNKKYLPVILQRQGRQNATNVQVWEQREKIGGILA
jgi:hypothetical protein